MSNFSIIIPVYNEEKSIGVLLDELGDILGSNYEYEIIVVDDKSTDRTVAEVIKKMNSNKKVINNTNAFDDIISYDISMFRMMIFMKS